MVSKHSRNKKLIKIRKMVFNTILPYFYVPFPTLCIKINTKRWYKSEGSNKGVGGGVASQALLSLRNLVGHLGRVTHWSLFAQQFPGFSTERPTSWEPH